MSKRIYKVTDNESPADIPERLVKAGTTAQAVGHVVRKRFDVEVASQDDIAKLAGAGVKVETAGEKSDPPAGDPPVDGE